MIDLVHVVASTRKKKKSAKVLRLPSSIKVMQYLLLSPDGGDMGPQISLCGLSPGGAILCRR